MKKILIHTVDGYGLGWIYSCIDFGIAIAKEDYKECKNISIEIIVYKNKDPITINKIIAKIIDKIICIRKIKKYNKIIELDYKSLLKNSHHNKNNFYYDGGNVSVNYINLEYKKLQKLYAYVNAVKYWLTLINKKNSEILLLNYKGINIGDIIGSETLRFYQGHAGSLRKSNALFHNLFRAILYVNKYNEMKKLENNYIMTPDRVYFPEILSRIGEAKSGKIVRADPDYGSYEIITAKNSKFIVIDREKNIKEKEINEYLRKRIESPSQVLDYMDKYYVINNEKILDVDGNKITLKNELVVIVYPHLVSDANYWRGLDGYADLVDWLIQTLNILIANKYVGQILVKFHPNIGRYVGDYIYENKIIDKFKKIEKVIFINRYTGNQLFKKVNRLIAITHHGSISEEMTYLRIPNIRWAQAPGADRYEFSQFQWSNKYEYEKFLSNVQLLRSVSQSDIMILKNYVKSQRLCKIPYVKRKPESKFRYYINSLEKNLTHSKIDDNLINHDFGSEIISKYHNWLIDDRNLKIYFSKK